ncbi:GFA family protein [Pseudooceanicola sp. LIPI14-2-Ac024]|uniref:GFA family protein n=1 Tax=Pseudooceanicola sp. LIPI14-2-Ac024 TaxID=3344875 RepID=UPI0035CF0B92
MQSEFRDRDATAGMCQCGAVRYRIAAGPALETICGCRMCQRASGNFVSAFYMVADDQVVWEGTPPAIFASSDVAERGFCAACGTPLYFRETGSGWTEFLAATLRQGTPFDPKAHVRSADTPAWATHIGDIPVRDAEGAAVTRSHQAPEE